MKTKIVIIQGPTATGKSSLAIELAKIFKGEIVNADSMQVYKYMDIGTCKTKLKERVVPHHLFDIVEPSQDYSASKFVEDATKVIGEIAKRKNLPIIIGGTGLYIKCLLGGIFEFPSDIKEQREQLAFELKNRGLDPLYEELRQADPQAASKIKKSDKQRILRALEVYRSTGMKISDFQKTHQFKDSNYNALKIGLRIERPQLLEIIRLRTQEMFQSGLIQEVETLLNKGYKGSFKALNSIGYKEALQFIQGAMSKEVAIEQTYKRTKDYAKRQMTWFKKDKEVNWYNPKKDFEDIRILVTNFLKT